MEKEQTTFEKIAAEIASNVSSEKIKEFAENALTEAVGTYEVRKTLQELIVPEVTKAAVKSIPSEAFQNKIKEAVEKELAGIIECSVKQV